MVRKLPETKSIESKKQSKVAKNYNTKGPIKNSYTTSPAMEKVGGLLVP